MAEEELVVGAEPLPSPRKEKNDTIHAFLKLLASALFVGFLYSLLLCGFSSWSKRSQKDADYLSVERTDDPYIRLFTKTSGVGKQSSKKEVCDLSKGEWIPNPAGPTYTNATCNFMDSYQNCLVNRRPDTSYLYWRWKPEDCDLPLFDAGKFLKNMQDKSWALIGDSISSNQIHSLICLLSKIEEPVEVYHDMDYKSRTWYYSSYNFTLAVIWAPFLVQYETVVKEGSGSDIQFHLDVLDKRWITEYHKFNYIIISGGQWFYKSAIMWENNRIVGCHNCPFRQLKELGVAEPYRKALRLALHFIATSEHKPVVIFRTWIPDHFEHGKWYSGGVCDRTEPFKEGEFGGDRTDHQMRRIEIEEFDKAADIGAMNGLRMELLDTYHLSLLRPDGHPGPYRKNRQFDKDKSKRVQYDCLHWCLPGPIDTWNQILMKIVIDENGIDYIHHPLR